MVACRNFRGGFALFGAGQFKPTCHAKFVRAGTDEFGATAFAQE